MKQASSLWRRGDEGGEVMSECKSEEPVWAGLGQWQSKTGPESKLDVAVSG